MGRQIRLYSGAEFLSGFFLSFSFFNNATSCSTLLSLFLFG